MSVYLAWSAVPVPDEPSGPWIEVRQVAEGVTLVESTESLSRVYHELKWNLPEGTALVVAPLTERPKLKGLAPGTTTWLKDRLPADATRPG